ncbi:MAG: 5-oxoprolinase subunit PxpB [Lachnospiraceae bacterium]|nr:5-oxoprolinase subunit PxpB [Lachnospiraceae bacterium]
MQQVKILTEGDSSLLIVFGDEISPEINSRISAVVQLIRSQKIRGIIDLIPSYSALLINYNPQVILFDEIKARIESILSMDVKTEDTVKTVVEIPVLYGGDAGPDLQNIADHAGLTPEEVIEIHSSRDYLIYMLGFLPGFCYLGGLDPRIHTPRLANPRLRIREGSVGIGGNATGIYPMDSPGGWQLMGLTPVKTFDPNREVPILLQAGQYIRFIPIDQEEFDRIKALSEKGEYECVIHTEGGA